MIIDMEELLHLDSIGKLPAGYEAVVRDYKEAVNIAAKKLAEMMDEEIYKRVCEEGKRDVNIRIL